MSLDWENLGFQYRETACHIKYTWRDGAWNEGEIVEDPYIKLHIAATSLHYGQAAFEGLKAFRGEDGKVRIFRPEENAKRLQTTAKRIFMAEVPTDLFIDAISRLTKANAEFIPPYGHNGALYLRPMLFGSGPQIGINPSDEFTFIVFSVPVGAYYKGGLTAVDAVVVPGFDRAAPQGVGHVKVAGNYAASLMPASIARAEGYPINLYLDAKGEGFIDEFGTSNFIGLKGDKYITPKSESILPSITNMTLMQLAQDNGFTVEERAVHIDEIEDFDQWAACGTAVVVTPINSILNKGRLLKSKADGIDTRLTDLYTQVTGIQTGEIEDKHDWCHFVDC